MNEQKLIGDILKKPYKLAKDQENAVLSNSRYNRIIAGVARIVVVYKRFIWSTYIKYYSLDHPVKSLEFFCMFPMPKACVVPDVPVSMSVEIIRKRESHIMYPESVLKKEIEMWIKIAKKMNYPIIDSTKRIRKLLSKYIWVRKWINMTMYQGS
ncbi:MAG: hypothetical protein QXY74_06745 [Candidatus Bathyarchaeia archaeon]